MNRSVRPDRHIIDRAKQPAAALARLLVALGLILVAAIVLRRVSLLVGSRDLWLTHDLVSDRTAGLTALAHALPARPQLPPARNGGRGGRLPRDPRTPRPALTLIVSVLGAIVVQDLAKTSIDRPRPPVARLEQVNGSSFPSGHATETSAFFIALIVIVVRSSAPRWVKRATVIAGVILIAGVALSRVYLGAHYATDVIAGVLLGTAWSSVVAIR